MILVLAQITRPLLSAARMSSRCSRQTADGRRHHSRDSDHPLGLPPSQHELALEDEVLESIGGPLVVIDYLRLIKALLARLSDSSAHVAEVGKDGAASGRPPATPRCRGNWRTQAAAGQADASRSRLTPREEATSWRMRPTGEQPVRRSGSRPRCRHPREVA